MPTSPTEAITVGVLSRQVRSRRKGLGYSQERLAHEAEVSLATINRVERGFHRPPRLDTLARIATALGVTTVDLLSGEPIEQAS